MKHSATAYGRNMGLLEMKRHGRTQDRGRGKRMRIGIGVLLLLVIGSVALAVAGCSGGGNSNLPDPVVRFVNSSPDANPLDYLYDNDLKATGLNYLASSAEFTVKQGDHDFSVQDSTNQNILDAL